MNKNSLAIDERKPGHLFSRTLAFLLDIFLLVFLEMMVGAVEFFGAAFF